MKAHDPRCASIRESVRPKFMTVATMMLGLVPIMWSAGTGADVMKRIAAPLIGGIVTSFVLEPIRGLEVAIRVETWRGGAIGGCDPSLLGSDEGTMAGSDL
jgi:AcrB/AcrD/AcrF family